MANKLLALPVYYLVLLHDTLAYSIGGPILKVSLSN
jgi:hypothetical protein